MKTLLVAPFKWIVVVELDEDLVADGLDLNDERVESALARAFPLARTSGISARVVKGPSAARVAKAQGATTTAKRSGVDFENGGHGYFNEPEGK